MPTCPAPTSSPWTRSSTCSWSSRRELLEGDEPHLEFFDTVEDLETVVLTEDGPVGGDLSIAPTPEPRGALPKSTLTEDALDALLPDDERS